MVDGAESASPREHGAMQADCGSDMIDEDKSSIDRLVAERVRCREDRDYAQADEIKKLLERHYDVVLTDVARKHGGGTKWAYRTHFPDTGAGAIVDTVSQIKAAAKNMISCISKSETAETAECSGENEEGNRAETMKSLLWTKLVEKLKTLIHQDLTTTLLKDKELQGRRHGDIAFDLALAGVDDVNVFNLLVNGAKQELERCGSRKSMRGVDIIILCERFAAAGVCNQDLFELAAQKIEPKLAAARASAKDIPASLNKQNSKRGEREASSREVKMLENALARLRSGQFGLMDDRALALLWRHSSRQYKSGKQTQAKIVDSGMHIPSKQSVHSKYMQDTRASQLFKDPSLPLVIDLGCGYGTSLIGLCASQRYSGTSMDRKGTAEVFNFLGFDMSTEAIRYGQSVSNRWFSENNTGECRFLVADCESGLDWVMKEYPGQVYWVLCQFPSPYHLNEIFTNNFKGAAEGNGFSTGAEDKAEAEASAKRLDSTHKRRKVLDDIVESRVGSQKPLLSSSVQISTAADHSRRDSGSGNSQLPGLEHFMFSPDLLTKIEETFLLNGSKLHPAEGKEQSSLPRMRGLFLQSNAEDVCVTMRRIVEEHIIQSHSNAHGDQCAMKGCFFRLPHSPSEIFNISQSLCVPSCPNEAGLDDTQWVTNTASISKEGDIREGSRLTRYLELLRDGGKDPRLWRAIGQGYLRCNPFHTRTETEAICAFQGKSVHRVCFLFDFA